MSVLLAVLLDSVRRLGFAQLPHAVAGLAAYYLGSRYPLPMRLALWLSCAVFFTAIGAAGYAWGQPGMPLLLTATLDPHLWRPVPGLIELGGADHLAQLTLGLLFAGASARVAWRWSRLRAIEPPAVVERPAPRVREPESTLSR